MSRQQLADTISNTNTNGYQRVVSDTDTISDVCYGCAHDAHKDLAIVSHGGRTSTATSTGDKNDDRPCAEVEFPFADVVSPNLEHRDGLQLEEREFGQQLETDIVASVDVGAHGHLAGHIAGQFALSYLESCLKWIPVHEGAVFNASGYGYLRIVM